MSIKLEGISKKYDRFVLDNINLTFPTGQITCLMGPSGIGKTILTGIISGLIKPDSGQITGTEGKKISVVFQEDRLMQWETALNNVLFVTKSARKSMDKAKKLLSDAGLADSMYKKASELSGGMKRRVCICRALIVEYDILILDEPFNGLDGELKQKIMTMVKDDFGNSKTVICITHDPAEAEYLGGKIVAI